MTTNFHLIDRDGEPPLLVTVQRLTDAERACIPMTADAKMGDVYKAIAPYILDWNLEAVDVFTGVQRAVPVPSQAAVGWEVLEVLDSATVIKLAMLLKRPEKVGQV